MKIMIEKMILHCWRMILILLILQNALLLSFIWFSPLFFSFYGLKTSILIDAVFILDIIGFFAMGIEFLGLASINYLKKRGFFLVSGGGFLGWTASRVGWQFIIPVFDNTPTITADEPENIDGLIQVLSPILPLMIISALFLGMAAIGIRKTFQAEPGFAFSLYAFINLVALIFVYVGILLYRQANLLDDLTFNVLMSIALGGALMKILVVPLLGIHAFLKLFNSTQLLERPIQVNH